MPHYRRIANALLLSLRDGESRRVPSENALARQYGVARQTARRALEELRAQGYVSRVRGSGSFSRSQSARRVYLFGYLLNQSAFAAFSQRLNHQLGAEGLQLRTIETGFQGEELEAAAEILTEIKGAEMAIWFASSHPVGLKAAARVRRHLPARLPLIMINDPLGLTLHGSHRFDLVHFDAADAARRLLDFIKTSGQSIPTFVTRSDVSLYYTQEMKRGWLAALAERGERDPDRWVMHWNPERPSSLIRTLRQRSGDQSPTFLLEYDYCGSFQYLAHQAGIPLRSDQVMAFGQRQKEFYLAGDLKALADVCADLVVSRLRRPSRPNLHLELHMRFRPNPAKARGSG